MKIAIERALKNVIRWGDTDIFPFPFERALFDDKLNECTQLLIDFNKNFSERINEFPPLLEVRLSQVGYFGFRRASLIEPFWNAYYLALVLSIADKIEKERLPNKDKRVFSYRFKWNKEKSSCFDEVHWYDYRKYCVELSKKFKYIVQTDIADFYDRIYHHRLENELKPISANVSNKLIKLLKFFSNGTSYGLPVGGPASRILAELALNRTDHHLVARGLTFCRYADDYTIFCNSEAEAYNILLFLADKLSNDGLGLQKSKTRIMSTTEFQEIHSYLDPAPSSSSSADEEQKLLNISVQYDPYSDSALEDYRELKKAVREIDIIGILSREVAKTRIDQTVTKQAINSIKVLKSKDKTHALRILLDQNNLMTLSPVFISVMRAIRKIYMDQEKHNQNLIDRALISLFDQQSHLISIEINLCYVIQVLAFNHSKEKEKLLISIYEKTNDVLIRRLIITAMANWKTKYWLSDIRKTFNALTVWERRAFIYASYSMGDEGSHWRKQNKGLLSRKEILMKDWFSERHQAKKPVLV